MQGNSPTTELCLLLYLTTSGCWAASSRAVTALVLSKCYESFWIVV